MLEINIAFDDSMSRQTPEMLQSSQEAPNGTLAHDLACVNL